MIVHTYVSAHADDYSLSCATPSRRIQQNAFSNSSNTTRNSRHSCARSGELFVFNRVEPQSVPSVSVWSRHLHRRVVVVCVCVRAIVVVVVFVVSKRSARNVAGSVYVPANVEASRTSDVWEYAIPSHQRTTIRALNNRFDQKCTGAIQPRSVLVFSFHYRWKISTTNSVRPISIHIICTIQLHHNRYRVVLWRVICVYFLF